MIVVVGSGAPVGRFGTQRSRYQRPARHGDKPFEEESLAKKPEYVAVTVNVAGCTLPDDYPFTVDPEQITGIQVQVTVVDDTYLPGRKNHLP